MGEAKRKLEELRRSFLAEIESWTFPATEWEARTVAEIRALPSVTVRRYPDEVLAQMRMPPRQCHPNARFMQDNDPERRLRHVVGWWPQGGNYVLHSVVDQYGQYVCVTPAPFHPTLFEFIPDPKITWQDEGDRRIAHRDGVPIGPGVRIDPARTIAEIQLIKAKLLSGMNPYEACRFGL